MAQTTEAACLLKTGAMYTQRIGLQDPSGNLVFAGIKRGAFSLYHDDDPIFHFDLEGRWQRAFIEGTHYRKGLDNTVVAIDRVRDGANLVLKRRTLPFFEAADLDARIRDVALDLLDRVASCRAELIPPPTPVRPLAEVDLRAMLDRISEWDSANWFAHRERYLAAYGPLGFLPPDAHQSIVLQATLGDARKTRFGGGDPVEHAARTPSEFAAHVRAVGTLLGRRTLQNNGVFVGEGDVLRRPISDLIAFFEFVAHEFPLRVELGRVHIRDRPEDEVSLGGIDLFLDDLSPGLPNREALAMLKARGLRRINLGIESGDVTLRTLAGVSWTDQNGRAFASEVRAAGVALGVILLVGTGGEEAWDRHIEATADLANSLELGSGDLVYLIDAAEVGTTTALSRERAQEQTSLLRGRIVGRGRKAQKVVPYSLEKQWN